MDFNTGSSRPSRRPADRPSRRPSGGYGEDFDLSNPVGSFIAAVMGVLFNPVSFFHRGVARRGDFLAPAIFALICFLISDFLDAVVALFGVDSGLSGQRGLIGSVLLAPVTGAIYIVVVSLVLHLLVVLIARPSTTNLETTYRVVCYTSAVQMLSFVAFVLALVPILGILASLALFIYQIYLLIVGIRQMHDTTPGQAALIVLIPTGILIIVFVLIVAFALSVLFSGGLGM